MAAPQFEDLGTPSDLSAAPPRSAPPATDDTADTGTPGKVSPEHVHYHDDEQRCDGCSYFGRGNQCSYLGIPVSPEGGCIAYKNASGSDDSDVDEADTGYGEPDTDDYGSA